MLLNRNLIYLLLLSSFILVSCNEQDRMEIENSASAFDLKQAEAAVLQCNQQFMKAFKDTDSVAVSRCFTTDAKLIPPNQANVKGRDNILIYISKMMRSGIKEYNLTTIKVWGDSTILAEEGTYELSDKQGKEIDHGNFIALWMREAGNWKIYRNIRASSIPTSAIEIKPMNLPKH